MTSVSSMDQPRRSKRKREREKVNEPNKPMANSNKKTRKNPTKLRLREKIETESPVNEFVPNEVVLATIPGFAPWPARILNMSDQTILVEFFGTGQMQVDFFKNLFSE